MSKIEYLLAHEFILPDVDCRKLLQALDSKKLIKQQWAANVICFLCSDNGKKIKNGKVKN